VKIELTDGNSHGEPVWRVEIRDRESGKKEGDLEVGIRTGAVYAWQPAFATTAGV
jgi:hypothetical protein